MMITRCVLAVAMVLAGACGVGAQDVRGYVQEVDTTRGTITLTLFRMGLPGATFRLPKADIPVVNLAGQALKLSDVQPEDPVTLKLNSTGEDVVSIIAPLPAVYGPLTAVDPKKGELVLKLRTGPRTIAIPPETKILLHGMPATLKDLTVGDITGVTFAQDQKSIVEVRSGRAVGTPPMPTRRMGVLIEIDKDKRLARFFRTGAIGGDMGVLREVPFAKDVTFSLYYQGEPIGALKMEEITKGFDTIYWVDPVFNKIVHIDLHMPILVQRKVTDVDRKTGRITILNDDVESVLTLSPRIKVQNERSAATLDDIKPGIMVDCGLHPDRKQVELLIVPAK
jgi:hypothetical protein